MNSPANKGVKVRDLVCGMLIDLGEALEKEERVGEKYYFCSKHCKGQFKRSPEKFLPK